MLLTRDKVISLTNSGAKVGVYELHTDGNELLFETSPEIADKIIQLWNDNEMLKGKVNADKLQ